MKIEAQVKARQLRRKGHSLSEISKVLNVSKSSVSLWVSKVNLSVKAKKKILARFTTGQLASHATKMRQTSVKENEAQSEAISAVSHYLSNVHINKILCAMIYYCEGNKAIRDGVRFVNSDPLLISTFLKLFRSSFEVDESRFRCCVHLHSYHDRDVQLKSWSKIAKIPLGQFIKPYIKQSSSIYKKEGYQGCVSVRYGNTSIARELKALALEFMKKGL